MTPVLLDAVIVGAGPAGLSAALILGRCRRAVLICDTGKPRNHVSHAMHGYLSRDGMPPSEFLATARAELRQYESVEYRHSEVTGATCRPDGCFDVTLATGDPVRARKLLIATGVVDHLPEIAGFDDLYGHSVFHCPYCDGWEVRDQPLAIYGRGARGYGLSLELTTWSRDLVLCSDGPSELGEAEQGRLSRNGIQLRDERIARLEGTGGMLEHVVFDSGERLARRALFFTTGQSQRSDLSMRLGCQISEKGTVRTGKYETTHLGGLYVAGDASRDVQWVIVAAAEGAEAAFAINSDLTREDLVA